MYHETKLLNQEPVSDYSIITVHCIDFLRGIPIRIIFHMHTHTIVASQYNMGLSTVGLS